MPAIVPGTSTSLAAARHRRWVPALSIMLVTVISYIDRNTLAILAPTILHDTHLTAQQYGIVISCFSIAYMTGSPLWGRLFDRFGLRNGMTAAVAIWTTASVAHAWTGSFVTFASARTVLGAGESAGFPAGVRTVAQTLPPSTRGRGLALTYSGSALGAILAPLIITPVALRFGWHGAFIFTGIIGIAWLIFWRLTNKDVDDGVKFERQAIPWGNPAFWAFMVFYGMGTTPLAFITYDSSIYLNSRFHWSQGMLGAVLWIPPLGCEVGYLFWGWVVDRFGPQSTQPLMLAPVLLALPFAWTDSLPSGRLVLASMFLMMFVVGGITILALAHATRKFSGHAGLLGGLASAAFGALTTLIMPVLGRLLDHGRYGTSFRLMAAFPVVGYVLSRILALRTRN